MMTPRPNPDDQLHDFIEGRDALSQQLKALKNHPDQQAPAALDAAILAQIESALAQETNASSAASASNAEKLKQKKTPSFSLHFDFLFKHWAIPAGITALLVIGLTLQLRDHAQDKKSVQLAENKAQQEKVRVFIPAQISAEQAAPVEMHMPVSPRVAPPAPAPATAPSLQTAHKKAKSVDILDTQATSTPEPTILAEVETSSASLAKLASIPPPPTQSKATIHEQAQDHIQAQAASLALVANIDGLSRAKPAPIEMNPKIMGASGSLNRVIEQNQAQTQRTASTNAQLIEQEIKAVLTPANATRFAESTLEKNAELPMSMPKTAPAPKPAISVKPIIEEELSWLKRIEEQLKQEKNETALKEWQAFRKAYPHAQISEITLKKLQVLEQAKKEP
jgi:hypothetical protein